MFLILLKLVTGKHTTNNVHPCCLPLPKKKKKHSVPSQQIQVAKNVDNLTPANKEANPESWDTHLFENKYH